MSEPRRAISALPSQQLSDEPTTLLAEAAKDDHGCVLVIRNINGTDIQTNDKSMFSSASRRKIAAWEYAVEQLVRLDLLVARGGGQGQFFEVTAPGYELQTPSEGVPAYRADYQHRKLSGFGME